MLRTTSAASAASAALAATRPSPTALARSSVRFHRISSYPEPASLRAIAAPILPVPSSATFTCHMVGGGREGSGRVGSADRDQRLVGADHLALLDVDLGHLARLRGHDVVLHLHGLEHRHDVAQLDVVADAHRH